MAPKNEKIAVIGAGFIGLVSLAALEEEGGFDPVCFEKTDKPGGTWCYREKPEDGVGSTMPSTISNTSKEVSALSTFPPKKESNNFMRHHEMCKYIMDYASSRGVLKYIRYKMEVLQVKRSDDYEETGKWTIIVKNRSSGETSTDVYDGVLVCIGHTNRPKMPSYSSRDLFKGEIMHTRSLKDVAPFKGKTVVVVGMRSSGLDAAVEISNVAKQVYISTRSGAHVFKRTGHHGFPHDTLLIRRYMYRLFYILPYQVFNWLFQTFYLDIQFDQKMYTIKPNHWVFSKDPALNDDLGIKLLSGAVIQRPNIQRFTKKGVIFEGDIEVTECDVVIMATGYTWKFPFLEEGILETKEGRINLYKCMFPPHLSHATLAIMGFVVPYGPIFSLGELQARWMAQILSGKCKLPSKEEMFKDIEKRHEYNLSRYGPDDKTTVRVDILPYCDELASQFGAKPNLFKVLFTDPNLFLKIFFGPGVSYQYRLQGPHSWEGAREAIMTTMDRVVWPTSRKRPEEVQDNFFRRLLKALLILILP